MATATASDAAMLADITNIAGKLKELPKDVLLYREANRDENIRKARERNA